MYNANYMDGVPVKIAEKYKPPPPIYKLPQPLVNKLNLEDDFYWNCSVFSYDLQLEKKALSKIEQWKRIRQRNKEQRKERILRREEQRKREDEDIQKNLLYSVSYPSTDDLSSGEEDEKIEDVENEYGIGISKLKEKSPQICVAETVSSFHNILQPTVLSFNSSPTANSPLAPKIKSSFDKVSNFNYKDFEDDTSSPFDNIELKTINDLDVLAQVLHDTQIKSPTPFNEKLAAVPCDNINESPKTCYLERQHKQLHIDSLNLEENIPKPNNNLPRFSHYFNSPQETLKQLRDHHFISSTAMQHQANLPPSSISALHLHNGTIDSNDCCNYQSNYCNQSINKIESSNLQTIDSDQTLTEDQLVKSKSVPDILKELRDEIRKSEIRRYRNCSYNMEESTEHIDVCKTNDATIETIDDDKNIFKQLNNSAKQLVEQITAMGFPFKRVARIVQLVGTDDKKVVEHLIPLTELADLGFEESKISDALIRNENNKNKALDELIS